MDIHKRNQTIVNHEDDALNRYLTERENVCAWWEDDDALSDEQVSDGV